MSWRKWFLKLGEKIFQNVPIFLCSLVRGWSVMPLLIIILLIRCYTALHVSTLIVISKANNMLIFFCGGKRERCSATSVRLFAFSGAFFLISCDCPLLFSSWRLYEFQRETTKAKEERILADFKRVTRKSRKKGERKERKTRRLVGVESRDGRRK